ncbi:MAG TPA: DNA repair protein RecN [Chthoniobacterales bacterium]|nr:DNA repair protein RecN [Chthoniobacterales bacterium]
MLLQLLRIKNLALVEDLEWEIAPGFTAITGETGAGKSIIIGALQLLLGERADKSLLRTGAETCTVEAIFQGDDCAKWNERLENSGIDPCDGDLILKRSLSLLGSNRQFINGSPTTLANLKELGDDLVDLHGPHDHQSLLSPDRQLDLLDAFAAANEERQKFLKFFSELRELETEHATLNTAETAREQELDLLRHQVNEINSANLSTEEETEIESRYRLASNSRRLIELASAVATTLSEADDAILAQLGETQKLLRELEKLDSAMAAPANAHESAVVELTEIAWDLSRYAENLDLDPEQLAALEQRVSLFESLKRKYGATIADVIAFGERAAERMRKIEGRDEESQRLANEIATHTAELRRTGDTLRKLRAKAAPRLSEMVRRNLRDLGFKQSQFEAKLSEAQIPRPSGFDTVELLFSPNPGEPLKPMRAIASSGEISRLMLAIKSALAAQDEVPLLVFDEIDANVGGEIAHAVGARMRELAKRHQVLCITHLPPVAAAATSQFVVTKEVRSGRTFTQLREVTGKARREEIARMLGGKSEEAMKLAAVMLETR